MGLHWLTYARITMQAHNFYVNLAAPASGYAATTPPPRNVMTSRRLS